MLPIVHHPDYALIAAARRGQSMSKYGYLRDVLRRKRILMQDTMISPAPFDRAQIALAHDAGYVGRVFDGTLTDDEIKLIGLRRVPLIARRARLASAGTTLAAWLAMEHGIACNTAGGSHHAHSTHGSGFCIFNDVAVAIRNIMAQGFPGPFAVVDADVHQGDGTAQMFASDTSVFTLSLHADRNFPHVKMSSDLDISLDDHADDQTYLEALASALAMMCDAIKPRLVFYNSGVDVHVSDRLGRLDLSDHGIRIRDRMVIEKFRQMGVPLVCVIGGGYDPDPERLAERHSIVFEEAQRAHELF